jgi:hypothetical protein
LSAQFVAALAIVNDHKFHSPELDADRVATSLHAFKRAKVNGQHAVLNDDAWHYLSLTWQMNNASECWR